MNRHGLSGESVLFALIGSGTDDLTLLVFSSKPCWMTQSSCAPSFPAVFVTAVRVGAQAVAAARLAALE